MAAPSERELDIEAQVFALEYLVKECLQQIFRMRARKQVEDGENKDIDELAVDTAKIFWLGAQELRMASFPDLYPASSDQLSALVRDHAVRVLKELAQEMEERVNQGA